MHPIIVSPHKFGLKDGMDKIFFPLMLNSLRQSNPGANIFLPNENGFKFNIAGIDEIDIDTKKIPGIEEIRRTYVHLSSNFENFELACIERFFILREVAKKIGVSEFFTIESENCRA